MAAKFWIALALASTGMASADVAGEGRPQDLEMQVEEPAPAPPIDPDQEAARWNGAPGKPALSKAQVKAYQERRRLVEAMATEVREKREALQNSTDAERAERVKELEQLILDPALGADKLEKAEKRLDKQAEAKAKALEKKLEKMEIQKEKSMEKKEEKLDREKEALDKP